jgi:hypothetical protein
MIYDDLPMKNLFGGELMVKFPVETTCFGQLLVNPLPPGWGWFFSTLRDLETM